MAGFTKARVLSIETMIKVTAWMILQREWVLVPQEGIKNERKGEL